MPVLAAMRKGETRQVREAVGRSVHDFGNHCQRAYRPRTDTWNQQQFGEVDRRPIRRGFALEFERNRYGLRGYKKFVAPGVFKTIGVGWNAGFKLKKTRSIAIDFILGSRGVPNQKRVEIVKDGAILLVDRAMGFIDDDEIEVPDAETALSVGIIVD